MCSWGQRWAWNGAFSEGSCRLEAQTQSSSADGGRGPKPKPHLEWEAWSSTAFYLPCSGDRSLASWAWLLWLRK